MIDHGLNVSYLLKGIFLFRTLLCSTKEHPGWSWSYLWAFEEEGVQPIANYAFFQGMLWNLNCLCISSRFHDYDVPVTFLFEPNQWIFNLHHDAIGWNFVIVAQKKEISSLHFWKLNA